MHPRTLAVAKLSFAAALLVSCTEQDPSGSPLAAAGGYADARHAEPTCDQFGRMTGGGGQNVELNGGSVYVTRGFTIHCDITLSNNLEINWPGNKWHIDKPLTLALCSDDPAVDPAPPPAPFDTFYGEGIGRLNGVDGALVQFTFIDAGEPGGRGDMAAIRVTDPNGQVVLDIPLSPLDNGNIQAHYDQPHGSNVNR